jgi:competence protein ComEC
LIQTPSGEVWLYDAGRLGDAQRSYLGIAGVLWANQISKIDQLLLSHADSDHFNAIAGLSKRFVIKRFLTTQNALNSKSQSLRQVFLRLQKLRVPTEFRHQGDLWQEGSMECRFLHPPAAGVSGSDNANSLCMLLEYAGHRILLPGDLEGEGTRRLISQPPSKVTVLMAPHHGSLSESPASVLDWCQPRYTVISGGTNAKSEKVHNAYACEGREVLVTAIEHAIRCTIDPDGKLRIECWRHPHWVTWQPKQGF